MQSTSPRDHVYQRLDHSRQEIRILVIDAGKGDQIRGSLRIISLLEAARSSYETVSYVWGDPADRGVIYIDGRICDVPASAEKTLRRMRLPDQKRILWIDAVCINQQDLPERGYQVGMMDLVYANGTRNLVWLGEDDGSTGRALEAIRAILLDARSETDGLDTLGSTLFNADTGEYLHGTNPLAFHFEHEPLLQFFSRPWFGRLWVVQETVLAPNSMCYCGDYTIALKDVLTTAIWLNYKTFHLNFRPHQGINNVMEIFNYADNAHGLYRPDSMHKPDMFSLLWDLSYFLASQPRDHVYALTGIFKKFQPTKGLPKSLAMPDYSTSLVNVLRDATIFAVEDKKNIRFLRTVELSLAESREYDLPTWVPRWGRLDRYMWTARPLNSSADGGATIDSWHQRSSDLDPNVLVASGFVLGKVQETSATMDHEEFKSAAGVQDVLLGAKNLELSNSDIPCGSSAIALTSGVNWQDERMSRAEAYDAASKLSSYITTHGDRPPAISDLGKQEYGDDTVAATRYHHSMRVNSHGRCLFTTSVESLGLGPAGTKASDIVAILYGCPWPVVLRSGDGDGVGIFTFVGCCFLDGIMDGEATKDHQNAGRVNGVFRIR